MKSNNKSLTKMAGIIMLGKIVAVIVSVLTPIFIIRIFNQEDFGLYKQAFLIAITFVPILGFGLGQNVYYFFPYKPKKHKAIVLNILLIYSVIGIFTFLLFVFYPSIILSIFKEKKIVDFIPWIGVYIIITLLSSFFEDVAIANKKIAFSSILVILSNVVRVSVVLLTALISKDILMVIWAATGFGFLRMIVFLIYISKWFRKSKYQFDFKLIKEQLLYTLPYGFDAILYYLRMQFHNFFVSFFFSSQMFAIYSIGVFQIPLINIVRQSVTTILISEISKLAHEGKFDKIRAVFSNSIRKSSLCFFPFFCFFFTIKREFIIALFTSNYIDSIPIFSLNLFSILCFTLISDPIFKAFPEYKYYRLKFSIILCAILPFILYFSYKKYDVIGVVLGNLVVTAMLQIVFFIKSLRILSFPKADVLMMLFNGGKTFLISVLSCIPLILLKSLVPDINLIVLLIIETMLYGIVYLVLLFKLNIVTDGEKQKIYNLFLNKIKRLKLSPKAINSEK